SNPVSTENQSSRHLRELVPCHEPSFFSLSSSQHNSTPEVFHDALSQVVNVFVVILLSGSITTLLSFSFCLPPPFLQPARQAILVRAVPRISKMHVDPMIVIGEHRSCPPDSFEDIGEWIQPEISRIRYPMYNGDNISTTQASPSGESMDMPSPASKTVRECTLVNFKNRFEKRSLRDMVFVIDDQDSSWTARLQVSLQRSLAALKPLVDDIDYFETPCSSTSLDTACSSSRFMDQRKEHRSLDGRRQNLTTHDGSATGAGYSNGHGHCGLIDNSENLWGADKLACVYLPMKRDPEELSKIQDHYVLQKDLKSHTRTIDNVKINNVKGKIHESWEKIDLWCLGIMISLAILTTLVKTPTLVDGRLPTDTILRLVFILGTQPFWSRRGREPAIDDKSTSCSATDGYLFPLQSSSCSIRAPRLLTVQ
ncbi:hypothetical protein QBC37DRAFT_60354, partial [Rhypophila decipiens]